MKNTKSKLLRKAALSCALLSAAMALTGCAVLVRDAVVSSRPTFQETERSWAALSSDRGRLVVYSPRAPASSQLWGAGESVRLTIDGDKSKSTSVGDQTFVFADLSPGTHTVQIKTGGLLGTKTRLPVDVRAGEIVFVEIETSLGANPPPRIVEASAAREALKKIHHNYKNPVPFHEQPKRARPAL